MSLTIEQQLDILNQGVNKILPVDGLKEKLALGRPLRIKLGFDPTRPDLHIGHAVVLRKLRQFQDLGHQVVVLIGDFTAKIGDPSGKKTMRPPLTEEEVKINAQTYCDQLKIILDMEKTEVVFNSDWLSKLKLDDILHLMGKVTVAQILTREDFNLRYTQGNPIGMHELMYPLFQAYDSIAIKADMELGGTDQTFNLLLGRELQPLYGQAPQIVVFMPILEGLDGVQKMSKSLDNYIGLTEAPKDMYGKVMSITDVLMLKYWEMCSDLPDHEVKSIIEGLKDSTLHPRDAKMKLAYNIVKQYHGEEKAQQAQDEFVKMFQKKEIPDEMPEFAVPSPTMKICDLMVASGTSPSKSEARRLITQNAVKWDNSSITDPNLELSISNNILQVGKRKFVKVINA